jgi:hypothetical protein
VQNSIGAGHRGVAGALVAVPFPAPCRIVIGITVLPPSEHRAEKAQGGRCRRCRECRTEREDDEIYLNQEEEKRMGAEQRESIGKMNVLPWAIVALAVMSGVFLAASASVWVWTVRYRF